MTLIEITPEQMTKRKQLIEYVHLQTFMNQFKENFIYVTRQLLLMNIN